MYKKISKGHPNVFKPRRMVIGGVVHEVGDEETLNKIKQEMQTKKEESAKAAEEIKNQKILIKRTVSKNKNDVVTKMIIDPDTILTKEEKLHQQEKNSKYIEHIKKPSLSVKSNIAPVGTEHKNTNSNNPITIKTHAPKLIKKSSNVTLQSKETTNTDTEQSDKKDEHDKDEHDNNNLPDKIVETKINNNTKIIETKINNNNKIVETKTQIINKPNPNTQLSKPIINTINNNSTTVKVVSRKNIKPLINNKNKNNNNGEQEVVNKDGEGTTILGGVVSSIFTKQDNSNVIPEVKSKPVLSIKTNDRKTLNRTQPLLKEIQEETTDNYFTKKYNVLTDQWYELIIKIKYKNDNSDKLLIKIVDDSKTQIVNPIKITNELFLHEKLPNNFAEYKIFLYMPKNIESVDIHIVGLKVYNTILNPVDKQVVEQNIDLWKFRKLYDLEFINYYINNADLEYSEKFIDRFKADYELYKNPNYFDNFINTLRINKPNVLSDLKGCTNADKINVLYLTHTSIEYEQYSYTIRTQQLLENFNKQGKYEIICATRYGYPFDRETGYYTQDLNKEIMINSVKYIKLIKDKTSNYNTLNILKYLEEYIKATINLCISKNIKIIHATTNFWNGIVAVMVAKYLGIKCIYELRELWNENILIQKPEVINSDMVKMMSIQEKNIISQVDKIIVLNKTQQKENEKTEILYDGSNINFKFKISKSDLLDKHKLHDKIIIGYIGTLVVNEGIEYILKCIKLLNNNKIMFVIIGDGPYKNSMIDYIKSNDIVDNILYLGKLKHELAIEYYQIFDACIFPKKKCELYELKSSFKLIEAMTFGKPVIVTNSKATNEIIIDGKNGLLCNPDDVNDLLDKIKLLLFNNELMEKLGKEAHKWIKKNRNWKNICKKLTNIYDDLLNEHNTNDNIMKTKIVDTYNSNDNDENNCYDSEGKESEEEKKIELDIKKDNIEEKDNKKDMVKEDESEDDEDDEDEDEDDEDDEEVEEESN